MAWHLHGHRAGIRWAGKPSMELIGVAIHATGSDADHQSGDVVVVECAEPIGQVTPAWTDARQQRQPLKDPG